MPNLRAGEGFIGRVVDQIHSFVWRKFGRHRRFRMYSMHTVHGKPIVTEHYRKRLAWQKSEKVENQRRRIQ